MSIEYTLYENDDPTKKVIFTTALDNISHYTWQDAVGLSRIMRNVETGEVEVRLMHTTINDKERVSIETADLEAYFAICEKLKIEPASDLLLEIMKQAENNGCDFIFV